jgi:hypothetical protein
MVPLAIALVLCIVVPAGAVVAQSSASSTAKSSAQSMSQSSLALDQALVLKVVLEESAPGQKSATRDLALKTLGREFEVSRFTESYKRTGLDVSIKSEIPISKALGLMGGIDKISRSSAGFFKDGKFLPLQVTEQRGSGKTLYSARIDHKKKKIAYLKDRTLTKEEAFEGELTDLIHLPYRWIGSPVPRKSFSTNITDARKIYRNEEFTASDMEVMFLGAKTPVVRFVRKRRDAETEGIEFWVRKSDGLPIRIIITLSKKYGLKIDSYPYQRSEIIAQRN